MMSGVLFSNHSAAKPAGTSHVVACVDHSENAAKLIPHAYAIAEALGVPVTLLQVLEATPTQQSRPDPIEWDLRRHEARSMLRELADDPKSSAEVAGIQLAEGQIADEIIRFTNGYRDRLLVLGTQGENIAGRHCIGGTVHNVLDRATDSVLLVPTSANVAHPSYDRIIVPLDGSPWAESVMPLAVRVAQATDAELVLVHVVPAPELTEPRPLEPEDMDLRCRVIERNERTAHDYLDRLRRQLSSQGLHVRVVMKRGDNVCTALAQIVATEGADLIIMSARGHGSCQHDDVRYGNVTSYLMTHAAMPVLIARPHTAMQNPEAALVANQHFSRMPAVRLA
jgi:nucleotide-binding universal stress UspA family protein